MTVVSCLVAVSTCLQGQETCDDCSVMSGCSQHLSTPMRDGSTALHLCAAHDKIECMKLLLRLRPDLCEVENGDGQTALDIARQYDHQVCIDIVSPLALPVLGLSCCLKNMIAQVM